MNNENLIPQNKRTKSEQRENAQKGGKASGEARRRKKALRTVLKESLHIRLDEIADEGTRKLLLQAAGAKDTGKTVGELIIGGLILSSVKGNSQMMRLLFELIGEDPTLALKRRELKIKEKSLGLGSAETAEEVHIYLPEKDAKI